MHLLNENALENIENLVEAIISNIENIATIIDNEKKLEIYL